MTSDAATQGAAPPLHRSRKGRRALLLVHGFLDDHKVWEPLLDSLQATDCEIARIDLAGMGERADAPGPYTLERQADDLAAALRALDKPVIVVGQSMGAQVAELAAARCPEEVAALVLITPVPLAGTRLPAQALAQFKSGGDPSQPAGEARRPLMLKVTPAMIDRFSRSTALIRPEVVPQLVDAWNDGHRDGFAPSRFSGPVLLLAGAGDGFVTAELIAQGVTTRFSQLRTAAIPDSGHWPHVEQPALVAAALDEFLNSLPA